MEFVKGDYVFVMYPKCEWDGIIMDTHPEEAAYSIKWTINGTTSTVYANKPGHPDDGRVRYDVVLADHVLGKRRRASKPTHGYTSIVYHEPPPATYQALRKKRTRPTRSAASKTSPSSSPYNSPARGNGKAPVKSIRAYEEESARKRKKRRSEEEEEEEEEEETTPVSQAKRSGRGSGERKMSKLTKSAPPPSSSLKKKKGRRRAEEKITPVSKTEELIRDRAKRIARKSARKVYETETKLKTKADLAGDKKSVQWSEEQRRSSSSKSSNGFNLGKTLTSPSRRREENASPLKTPVSSGEDRRYPPPPRHPSSSSSFSSIGQQAMFPNNPPPPYSQESRQRRSTTHLDPFKGKPPSFDRVRNREELEDKQAITLFEEEADETEGMDLPIVNPFVTKSGDDLFGDF